MYETAITAKMTPVTTPSDSPDLLRARGLRLRERVDELGLDVSKAARLAGGMSRGTVYKIFKGEASGEKVAELEAALDDYEANPADQATSPIAIASTEEGLIEIEIDDVYGMGRIVARGPNSQDLVDSVVEIIRRVRESDRD